MYKIRCESEKKTSILRGRYTRKTPLRTSIKYKHKGENYDRAPAIFRNFFLKFHKKLHLNIIFKRFIIG